MWLGPLVVQVGTGSKDWCKRVGFGKSGAQARPRTVLAGGKEDWQRFYATLVCCMTDFACQKI